MNVTSTLVPSLRGATGNVAHQRLLCWRTSFVFTLFLTLFTVCGIGCEQATAPQPLAPFQVVSATDKLWTERQGIGPDWFTFFYDRNMAIVPKDYVYAIVDGEEVFYLEVLSYTGPRGDFGFFTFKVAKNNDAPKEVVSTDNVEEGPLCFYTETKAFVACQDDHDIILKANRRSILDVAVRLLNPSIYTIPLPGREVYAIPATSMESIDRSDVMSWKKGLNPLPDAYKDHSQSRLRGVEEGVVQVIVTANYEIAAWNMTNESKNGYQLNYFCGVVVDTDPFAQKNLQKLVLPKFKNGAIYGVALCQGIVQELNGTFSRHDGSPFLKKEKTSYDFFIYVSNEGLPQFVLSPETLSWSYGGRHQSKTIEDAKNLNINLDLVRFADTY